MPKMWWESIIEQQEGTPETSKPIAQQFGEAREANSKLEKLDNCRQEEEGFDDFDEDEYYGLA